MSADRSSDVGVVQKPQDELQLAQFLVTRCALSDRELWRIKGAMEKHNLRFTDAALRLGLATQADIDAAHVSGNAPMPPPDARPAAELRIVSDPFDPHSERIRGLRTELMLRRAGDDEGVFAVVSPMAGEGRSRLVAELAISFAQLGQPTLLVDADLRRPRQHELFGLTAGAGLSEALTGTAAPDLHGVIGLPQLAVLTAGAVSSGPLELLSEPVFTRLLAVWRRRYRHIIFDTPPISECSDGLAVATAARQVLVLVRARQTPIAQTREMLHRLSGTQAQVLGSVLARY